MNCCGHDSGNPNGDHQNHKKSHTGGHIPHMLLMALCCGAPLVLLLAVSLLGTSLPGVRAVLVSILPFLCPILMIGMLPMMLLHRRRDDSRRQEIRVHEDAPSDSSERKHLN